MASTEQKPLNHHHHHHRDKKSDKNQSNIQNKFLYKALALTLVLIILPLFPSQAPEFVNQRALLTRAWELLHLVFVGIAISYGLFSRKNDISDQAPVDENDENNKDHSNNNVSRFLHVSPVFDSETEDDDSNNNNSNKVQTWSSQYQRGDDDPVVLEKPLLLPVRSLKETTVSAAGENGLVLPSPIPWRSRSGRFDVKNTFDDPLRSQSFLFSDHPDNNNTTEEFIGKRKSFYGNPPPPPPPPPPPAFYSSRLKVREKVARESQKKAAEKEEEEVVGDFAMESDAEETESEDDDFDCGNKEMGGKEYSEVDNDYNTADESSSVIRGGDVDKKADEFIAKFREQIRLQRIESIKRSTAQMSKKMSR